YLARLCSGRRVMSWPSIRMRPISIGQTPATALSIVDLPAPLPPMTVTKSPSSSVSSRPLRATFSLTVPGLKVVKMFLSSSMGLASLLHIDAGEVLRLPVRHREEKRDDDSREHLEHIGVDAEPDADLQNGVVDDAAHRNGQQLEGEVVEDFAEDR